MSAQLKYVLYHGNCPDGFTAAWAAWKSLGDSAKYIPVSYGRDLPEIEEDRAFPPIVYIVDFSYSRDVLIALNEKAVVRVLDHHKTAEADLAGLSFCTFDMTKSGAMLSWEYFRPGRTPVPRIVQYVQDQDLWRWALPNSKEISAWYMSYEYSFEKWDMLESELQTNYAYVIAEGQAILRAKDQMINTMAKQ
ncbi:MAG: hypothetical protein MN733_08585, partial [Nitrososphaera sp.]|nr:hypothetical protein [Nitrososphaera sp.]